MKEKIEARIKEISQALEHSAASHNSMLGRLDELQKLYNDLVNAELPVMTVVDDIKEIIHPSNDEQPIQA